MSEFNNLNDILKQVGINNNELESLLKQISSKRSFYDRFGFMTFVCLFIGVLYLISTNILLPVIFAAVIIVAMIIKTFAITYFFNKIQTFK